MSSNPASAYISHSTSVEVTIFLLVPPVYENSCGGTRVIPVERPPPPSCGFWSEPEERSCSLQRDQASFGSSPQTVKSSYLCNEGEILRRSGKKDLLLLNRSFPDHLFFIYNQGRSWEGGYVSSHKTHFKSESF